MTHIDLSMTSSGLTRDNQQNFSVRPTFGKSGNSLFFSLVKCTLVHGCSPKLLTHSG